MRTINEIILKNFRSHKDTTIMFDKHFNCIIGHSDSGKSAIIGALSHIYKNNIKGSEFITLGEDECSITLKYDDGSEIIRTKGNKKNEYIIKEVNSDVVRFSSFGTNVPNEVTRFLKGNSLKLDKDTEIDLNFLYQKQNFLVLENSAMKAKFLSNLSNVHIFDAMIRNFQKYARQKELENNIVERDIDSYNNEINNKKFVLDLAVNMITLNREFIALENNLDELEVVKSSFNELKEIQKNAQSVKQYIESVNVEEFIKLDIEIEKLKNIKNEWDKIRQVEKQIMIADDDINELNNKKESMIEEYKQELLKLKICPLCKTSITDETVMKCVKEFTSD